MYEDLAAQLGIDLSEPTDALARDLIEADDQLLEDLVRLRKQSGLRPAEVARRMGRDRSAVTQFEKLTADPRLSTIRRYALAVGARITHRVEKADERLRTRPIVDVVWTEPTDAADFLVEVMTDLGRSHGVMTDPGRSHGRVTHHVGRFRQVHSTVVWADESSCA
ncbi:helix-turn-helix domain-containing protein [Nocardia rhamnosiphila]|uniref:Helix-turn-helix domain-containing protein n=2 Tax=Nocardia rhamnosiphila TaxID=426716 RepID=A0ABV2WT78_9NOCA